MNRPWVFKAYRLVEAGRLDDAIQAFRAIADDGEPRGWLGLGRCLLRQGDPNRLEEAVACFERAAEGEAWGAAFNAAMLLVDPALGLLDGPRALPHFATAIDVQKSSIAASRTADLYHHGRCGVTADAELAHEHYTQALEFEDEPGAWHGLARLAMDADRVLDAARCAVRGARAALDIASGLPAHARAEYDAYSLQAAELLAGLHPALEHIDSPEAGHWLGEATLLGLFDGGDRAVDDETAHRLIARAADAGMARAAFVAWVLWRQGALETDAPDGWLSRAAEGGVAEAAHHLASNAFAAGDLERAVGLADAAADAPGSHVAAIRLAAQCRAALAETLDGAARDEAERAAANGFLRAALVRHDVSSMLEIGRRYRDGLGVERDLVQAWRWLMRPMRFGNGDGLGEVRGFVDEMTPDEIRRADLLADGDESWSATFLDELRDDEVCD